MRKWARHVIVDADSDRNMFSSFDGSLLPWRGYSSYDYAIVVDEASLSKEAYHHTKRILPDLKKNIHKINEREVMTEDNNKKKEIRTLVLKKVIIRQRMLLQRVVQRYWSPLKKRRRKRTTLPWVWQAWWEILISN